MVTVSYVVVVVVVVIVVAVYGKHQSQARQS